MGPLQGCAVPWLYRLDSQSLGPDGLPKSTRPEGEATLRSGSSLGTLDLGVAHRTAFSGEGAGGASGSMHA